MPRILSIDPRVPAVHGVLIPRAAVDEYVRAYTTVQEARAHARRIIKNAQVAANSIEQQAMREGFQAGWLDSLDTIYKALTEKEQFSQQLESAFKQSLQRELEKSLQKPGLELHLLDEWLNGAAAEENQLQIILPKTGKAEVIQRRVKEVLGIEPVVTVGATDNMVIQSGEQVFEFSPQRTFVELCNLAQQCFQRLQVKKQSSAWSEEVVSRWLASLHEKSGESNEDLAGSEADFFDELDDDDFDDADFLGDTE